MKGLEQCIEGLRSQFDRHRRTALKETPTRTIFIDPLLEALGWNVRDPDQVELEYTTIDGKSVDYALKINRKPVLFLEAKALTDSLDDVKALTQTVSYAANNGVEWCVLTNGIRYKVYRSSEKAAAPDKLLFEASLDPKEVDPLTVEQAAALLARLSRDSLERGALDQLGEEVFTTGKVRRALDRLFADPAAPILRLVRKELADDNITPTQIRQALGRIWGTSPQPDATTPATRKRPGRSDGAPRGTKGGREYPESHHTDGRPKEVVEVYRALDRFCQDLAPGRVTQRYHKMNVNWSVGKWIFCSAQLQQSRLKVWISIDPNAIPDWANAFARDVSNLGHHGVGDVALNVNSHERLREVEPLIRESLDQAPSQ
jgi:predicted transport protein